MAVKKLSFYLTNANINLQSDYELLKQFLQKTTLTAKVNKWGVELSNYNIRFKFIKRL